MLCFLNFVVCCCFPQTIAVMQMAPVYTIYVSVYFSLFCNKRQVVISHAFNTLVQCYFFCQSK